jgi:hypothetical protein
MNILMMIFFLKANLSIGDVPTAYTTPRGSYEMNLRIQKEGGLLLKMETSITDYLSIGISYGGINIIGMEDPEFYPLPGVHFKYMAVYEGRFFPALSFGISTQGFDRYLDDSDRYEVKSKGAFVALSKSFYGMGGIILNGGANYTFERKDVENGLDVFSSIQLFFAPEFAIFSDFTFGFNDNYNENGLLNIGAEFSFEDLFFLRISFRNVLNRDYMNRTIEIGYRGSL